MSKLQLTQEQFAALGDIFKAILPDECFICNYEFDLYNHIMDELEKYIEKKGTQDV
jgi:hypothetical protein